MTGKSEIANLEPMVRESCEGPTELPGAQGREKKRHTFNGVHLQ